MSSLRDAWCLAVCFGLATAGCATGSRNDGYEGEQLLVTKVDVTRIPAGVPANAKVFFAGKPGHTFAFHKGPLTESGTFYLYDDTAGQTVFTQHLSPDNPALQQPPLDPSHDYRGLFAADGSSSNR